MAHICIAILLSVLAFLAGNTMATKCPLSPESLEVYNTCLTRVKPECDLFTYALNPNCLNEEEFEEAKICLGQEKEILEGENNVYNHDNMMEETNQECYDEVRDEIIALVTSCEENKDFETQGKEIFLCYFQGVGEVCKD